MAGDSMFHSRRLLLLPSPPPQSPPQYPGGDNSFDANVVMVLSVLLCALICSLGLNSIIRCALRCSTLVADSPDGAASGGGGSSHPRSVAAAAGGSGIKKKALKMFPTLSYSAAEHANLAGLGSDCAICLSEFAAGERLRLLPKCHHGFHARCIDKWLNSHSSCPKCRHNLLETCQKIVAAGQTAPPPPNPPAVDVSPAPVIQVPVTVVDISPLQHEEHIRGFRGNV